MANETGIPTGSTPADAPLARPGKIVAVHLSYPSRAAQRGRTPAHPSYFLKPSSSIGVSGGELARPLGCELLAFEGEVALVIGSPARNVDVDEAWSHIAAVTAADDFGVYDLRVADRGSNVRSKGGDGFTPLGPRLIPAEGLDPDALRIRTWVNGELAQNDTTAGLLFPLPQLIADLSQSMTLETGDVILTGTPAGSSVVGPGDTVEVEVDAPGAPGAPTTGRLVTRIVEGAHAFDPALGDVPATDDTQRAEAWGSREAAGLPAPSAPAESAPDASGFPAERLLAVGTAGLSAALRRRGFHDIVIDGVRPLVPRVGFAGPARTLRFVPQRPDLFASHGGGYNAQKRLFDEVGAGEVIVIDARRVPETGTLGDVLALRARHRGAAGVVSDGGVRDSAAVAAIGLPVHCQGANPSVLGRRHVPFEIDAVIACGGAAVVPGDAIVADDDGAIVIPAALLPEVLEEAEAQEREDAWVAARVAEGNPVKGLFPPGPEWKARYLADREADQPDGSGEER